MFFIFFIGCYCYNFTSGFWLGKDGNISTQMLMRSTNPIAIGSTGDCPQR